MNCILAILAMICFGATLITSICLIIRTKRGIWFWIFAAGIPNEECQETPIIYAVVRSEQKSNIIKACGIKNYKSEKYNINLIGDFSSEYSYDRILEDRANDRIALQYHLKWVIKEAPSEILENVELYENTSYCQESSKAQVIHQRCLRKISHIIDAMAKEDQTSEVRKRIEHSRWNAYMRGIGYMYHKDKLVLGKLHPDLTAFDKLSKETQKKDVIDYEMIINSI